MYRNYECVQSWVEEVAPSMGPTSSSSMSCSDSPPPFWEPITELTELDHTCGTTAGGSNSKHRGSGLWRPQCEAETRMNPINGVFFGDPSPLRVEMGRPDQYQATYVRPQMMNQEQYYDPFLSSQVPCNPELNYWPPSQPCPSIDFCNQYEVTTPFCGGIGSQPTCYPCPSVDRQPKVITSGHSDWIPPFPLRTKADFENFESTLSNDWQMNRLISYLRQQDIPAKRQIMLKKWLHQDAVQHISLAGRKNRKKVKDSPFFGALFEAWIFYGDEDFKEQVGAFLKRAHCRSNYHKTRGKRTISGPKDNIDCSPPPFWKDVLFRMFLS